VRDAQAPALWVGTHHKSMTTYFSAVLRLFAYAARLKLDKIDLQQPPPGSRLFLSNHSKMDLAPLAPYRGIHVMRDPRDMIVSGYHYHKWTNETWARRPDDNGRSYQQKLQEADTRTGPLHGNRSFHLFLPGRAGGLEHGGSRYPRSTV
jgi:hypothetical protein